VRNCQCFLPKFRKLGIFGIAGFTSFWGGHILWPTFLYARKPALLLCHSKKEEKCSSMRRRLRRLLALTAVNPRTVMTTLTSNDQPTTLTTSAVSLHIIQPGADERIVPLPSGKCTVGSSDRCQVHLRDAQVRPLHCLIIHEATGTFVTRWAPGALLNDQDFATAPFQPGDCLQIGDVQLLLVANCASRAAGCWGSPARFGFARYKGCRLSRSRPFG